MPKDSSPRKEAWRVATLVVLMLSPVWMLVTWYQASNAQAEQRQQIREILSLHRDSFEQPIRRLESELGQLHEFSRRHDGDSPEDFESAFEDFSSGMRADSGWVQAYQLVDDGIITHCFPRSGNEIVLGMNLYQHPRREVSDDLRWVMRTEELRVTGPVELWQGGTGILLRGPGSTVRHPGRSVAIIVRLEPLLLECGIDCNHATLQCAMRQSGQAPFYGVQDVFESEPEIVACNVMNKSWEFAVIPSDGWFASYRQSLLFFGGNGAAILALAWLLTYSVALRQRSLRNSLTQRTQELYSAHAQLEREVKLLSATESQLRFSETRFRAIFEQAALGVAIVHPKSGQFVQVNDCAAGILGYTEADLQGVQLSQVICSMDIDSCADSLNRLLAGEIQEYSLEHRCVRRDGSLVWVNQTVSTIDENSDTGTLLIVLFEDIQRRKSSERRLQVLADSLPGLLLYIDRSLVVQFVNVMGEKWHAQGLGMSNDEMLGRSLRDVLSAEQFEFVSPWIARALNGETVEFVSSERPLEGEPRFRNIIYAPHCAEDESVPGFFALIMDITDRRRVELKRDELERHLMEAQKMEAVGTLAGGIAHDFNNMLQVILGYSEILLLQSHQQSTAFDQLNAIQSAARRSSDLTHQLLAFARRQSTAPLPMDLSDAVPRMLRLMRRVVSEEICIEWNPDDDLWRILIDPAQLDQIIANVIVNSRDAISGPGKITLAARNLSAGEEPHSDIIRCTPGDFVHFSICDNGIGMDQITQWRIFEPFFTTKELGKGTGLGLSTVYGIVSQHNGTISVSSAPGCGATFHICFPRCLEPARTLASPPTFDDDETGSETILLVEDEPLVLNLGKSLLERLGYRVIVAETADQAIRIAETTIVHLLITDVIMPDMNGQDLAESILSHQTDMRVLFISGFSSDVMQPADIDDSDAEFLQKPFSPGELANIVREILSQHRVKHTDLHRS